MTDLETYAKEALLYDRMYGMLDFKGKKVLDVGADYGSTATFFLEKGASQVIAVEGNIVYYLQLERNTAINIIPIYLWIESKEDFENLILQYTPDIAKMDCEGCEKYFAHMDDQTLSIVPEYVIEAHDDETFARLLTKFENNGYEIASIERLQDISWTHKLSLFLQGLFFQPPQVTWIIYARKP